MEKMQSLATQLITQLLQKSLTLSVAESCTGGALGSALTAIPGSSQVFRGGVIAYHNEVKHHLLGVSNLLLQQVGAVSAEVAEAMASGAAKVCQTHVAIALTGIAGPSGGSIEKPVGLVWCGFWKAGDLTSVSWKFSGDRQAIREQAVIAALQYGLEQYSR